MSKDAPPNEFTKVLPEAQPDPVAEATAPAPPIVESQLGVGPQRQKTQGSSLVWVEMWLSNKLGKHRISLNRDYPETMEEVTIDILAQDHMVPFVSRFASWFANNELPKLKGEGNLVASAKKTYFKAVKQALVSRYPEHPLFRMNADTKWWQDILDRFGRDSNRADQNDHSQSNAVKSAPLYRDTTSDSFVDKNDPLNSSDALYRAKNRGKLPPNMSLCEMSNQCCHLTNTLCHVAIIPYHFIKSILSIDK